MAQVTIDDLQKFFTEKDGEPSKTVVAGITYEGTAITLPDDPTKMPLKVARDAIQRRMDSEEEDTVVRETINAAPWDFAFNLWKAMRNVFGWVQQEPTASFFGDKPPELRDIEVGFRQHAKVPWGKLSVPTLEGGYVETGVTVNRDGMVVGQLSARVKNKYTPQIDVLVAEVRRLVETESIYSGQALKVKFTDDEGDPIQLPEPEFLDVAGAVPERLVFNRNVQEALEDNLFTPLQHFHTLKEGGEKWRRGVLLVGAYGTGKTETVLTSANLATQNGVTFFYVEKAADVPMAVTYARHYSNRGAAVFCEDIDRSVPKDGERTEAFDKMLNTIDGLDSKRSDVMIICTTNDVQRMHNALLRPGRFDAIIEIERPNADSVERLIRLYAGDQLDPDADISEAAFIQAGNIPAIIGEVVKRSKLANLRLTGDLKSKLTGEALRRSAEQMKGQLDLLNRPEQKEKSDLQLALQLMGQQIGESMRLSMRAHDGLLIAADESPMVKAIQALSAQFGIDDHIKEESFPDFPREAVKAALDERNATAHN